MVTKRVLMICCLFPPIGGSGVQRSAKFVKYLPQFGWKPFVVAATRSQWQKDGFDETLASEIPSDVIVHRIYPIFLPSLLTVAQNIFNKIFKKSYHIKTGRENQNFLHVKLKQIWSKIKWRLELLDVMIRKTPDAYLFWAIRSIPKCLHLIKKYKINLIYATAQPYSSLLIGVLIKFLTHKPLVLDFRDPWSMYPDYQNDFRKPLFRLLEKIVLQRADRIIAVNELIASDLFYFSRREKKEEFLVIPHGFDCEDFSKNNYSNLRKASENSKVTITFLGLVYSKTSIPFFKALELVKDYNSQCADRILAQFVGYLPLKDHEYLDNSPIKGQVQVFPRATHSKAIQYMLNSDVLLLLVPSGDWKGHRGKLFEYIYAKVPILALAPKGLASELIQQTGTGITISPSDIEGIANILRKIAVDYEGFKREYFHPNEEDIIKFDRKKLTQRLAEVFDELATQKRI